MLLRALNLPPNTLHAERLICQQTPNGLRFAPFFQKFPETGTFADGIELTDYTGCGKYYEFSVHGILNGYRVLRALLIVTPDCHLLTGRVREGQEWREATQTDVKVWIKHYVWDVINL